MNSDKCMYGFQLIGCTGANKEDLTQYEVFRKGKPVAHIRMRHGKGAVFMPPRSKKPIADYQQIESPEEFIASAMSEVNRRYKGESK